MNTQTNHPICRCEHCKCNRAMVYDGLDFYNVERHRCIACGHLYKSLGLIEPQSEATVLRTEAKPGLTKAQRKALEAYRFAERQEDRYMGSVFVNAIGQRQMEAKTTAAYQACKDLGMTWQHGL